MLDATAMGLYQENWLLGCLLLLLLLLLLFFSQAPYGASSAPPLRAIGAGCGGPGGALRDHSPTPEGPNLTRPGFDPALDESGGVR